MAIRQVIIIRPRQSWKRPRQTNLLQTGVHRSFSHFSQSEEEEYLSKVPPLLTAYIGNAAMHSNRSSGDDSIDDVNDYFVNKAPSTGQKLCNVQIPRKQDLDRAVESSQSAFESWSTKTSWAERGEFLESAASVMQNHRKELEYLEAIDSGVPIEQVRNSHIPCAIEAVRYYGALARGSFSLRNSIMDTPHAGGHRDSFSFTRREPLGVCLGIGAWNYPLMTMMWKVAPALACGNTMLYKPSESTPMTARRVAELFAEAGMPPGVLNVVPGMGDTAAALVSQEYPQIRKVSVTGSLGTGMNVAQQSAATLKRTTLELGGKSPLLIFEDATLESAVNVAIMGNFANNGQVCSNCTRVYVHTNILDDFLEMLVSRLKQSVVMGNNMDTSTNMGPLIMPPLSPSSHFDRVKGFIDRAKQDPRARLIYGGNTTEPSPMSGEGGYFIEPTVFQCDVDDMELVREEVFGPVMAVMAFESEEEAISRANDSIYGLGAGVMTNDAKRAHRLAKQLIAGNVWINNWNISPIEMPFGPFKMSGYGNECGVHAIENYSQVKHVNFEMGEVAASDTYF